VSNPWSDGKLVERRMSGNEPGLEEGNISALNNKVKIFLQDENRQSVKTRQERMGRNSGRVERMQKNHT
jgi:hypothetical protein